MSNKWEAWPFACTPPTVGSIFSYLYISAEGGGIEPFYEDFCKKYIDVLKTCYQVYERSQSEPEYFFGMLEEPYRELLRMFNIEDKAYGSGLEEMQSLSFNYKKTTK
jgi:hypothetical protein